MKRVIFSAICAFAMLALVPAAGAAIKITKVYFDSPGSDTGGSSSLNAESIRLKNTGSSARSLSGWTVRDVANHVYRFGTFTLARGTRHRPHGQWLHTGSHRYWRSGWYIWNNDGDTAKLKNSSGTLIDRCSYSGAGDYVTC